MTITSQTIYTTSDGKTFTDLQEAEKHEDAVTNRAERDYNQYITSTYAGTKLLKEHSLTEYGIWEVRGEDPNCDLGGHHHNPKLGKFEGTLEQVLRHAVTISGFWQWGSGGQVVRVDKEKIIKL